MSEKNLSIEERKKQLEVELMKLQSNIESSVSDLKEDAKKHFSLSHLVKKYPVTVLSAALVVGFIAAGRKSSSTSEQRVDETYSRPSTTRPIKRIEPTVSSLLMLELKRLITQKAISYATDYLDNFIESKTKKNDKE